MLEPGKAAKTDKSSIITDAIRIVTQLRAENGQLRQLNKFLEVCSMLVAKDARACTLWTLVPACVSVMVNALEMAVGLSVAMGKWEVVSGKRAMQRLAYTLQERVGTVEKQKNDLMMQQAMLQQQGEPSHLMQGNMMGAPYGPGTSEVIRTPSWQQT